MARLGRNETGRPSQFSYAVWTTAVRIIAVDTWRLLVADGRSRYFEDVARVLNEKGFECVPGLTDAEIVAAEDAHGFQFPADLRALLQHVLPVGEGFPNWRDPLSESIRELLDWPADGICFDIEHIAFWLTEWGERPVALEAAQERAREAVRAAPILIPVFSHRYLPGTPSEPGNPVFSVYQTDIIHYGFDLPSYLFAEFGVPNPYPFPESPRPISLWTQLCDLD